MGKCRCIKQASMPSVRMSHDKVKHRLKHGEHILDGVVYGKITSPELLEQIHNFPFDDRDIVVATFPKSGTTWVQKIIDFLRYPGDITDIKNFNVQKYMSCIEQATNENDPLKPYLDMTPPRIVKSHLYGQHFEQPLSGGKVKFVVVVRNVKDVLVSFYHFYKYATVMGPFTGTWNEFFDDLIANDHLCYGNWFRSVKSWLKYKDNPNVHFVKYEDMLKDLKTVIKDLGMFLGTEVTYEKITQIAKYSTFDMLKQNADENLEFEMLGPYMRKGKAGGWKDFYSEEQNKFIDKHYEAFVRETGFTVDFEV